jgi:hypothetical protein
VDEVGVKVTCDFADPRPVNSRRYRRVEEEFGCVIPLTVRQFSTVELREIITAVASFGWTRATLNEDRTTGRYFVAARGTTDAIRRLAMALPAEAHYRDGLLKRLDQAEQAAPVAAGGSPTR